MKKYWIAVTSFLIIVALVGGVNTSLKTKIGKLEQENDSLKNVIEFINHMDSVEIEINEEQIPDSLVCPD